MVLIAAEEGVYSLNLNELHDATLELVIQLFREKLIFILFLSCIQDEQLGCLLKITFSGQSQVILFSKIVIFNSNYLS